MNEINVEVIAGWIREFQAGTDHFLVDIKLSPGKLAILIDKPAGITIDECVELNRHLQVKLEASEFMNTHELEVGSPGMEQPLKVYNQYLRRIGSKVRVLTFDGTMHQGILKNADSGSIDLLETITEKENNRKIKKEILKKFSLESIKETKVVFTF